MAKLHIRRTIIFIILGIIVGFIYIAVTPKVYEGNLQLVVSNAGTNAQRTATSGLKDDVAKILDTGFARNPVTELNILRDRGLFYSALEYVAEQTNNQEMLRPDNFERYYSMYDVLGERDSDAATIRARAYSPETAALLANTLAEKYNEKRLQTANASVQSALAYLSKQIESSKAELQKALTDRKAYKEQKSLGDIVSYTNQLTAYQVQLISKLNEARADHSASEVELAKINAEYARQKLTQNDSKSFVRNPVLSKLEGDLADMKRQRAQLLTQYLPEHVSVRTIDDSIKSIVSQIEQERKQEYKQQGSSERVDPLHSTLEAQQAGARIREASLRNKVADLTAQVESTGADMKAIPLMEQQLADLEREVQVKENNIRTLKIQYEDINNRQNMAARFAEILFTARPNPESVFPDPLIVGLLSVFGGAALGLLYSFAIESLRLRIYTSYQLSDLTGLPVVSSLPKLPAPALKSIGSSLTTASPRILESLRLLAFSLVAQPHQGCRRLLFTGVDRRTGVSSSASQLAIALGHTGARVILVDADLMNKTTSRIFKSESTKGLAEALVGGEGIEATGEYLRDTPSANVKVLPAGLVSANAVKECETKRLEDVLDWLSSKCEYLIIDTPPCLRHSEAARMASETQEAYLVVSLRIASVPIVSSALDILRQAGAEVVRLLATEGDRSEEGLAREVRVSGASKALPQ